MGTRKRTQTGGQEPRSTQQAREASRTTTRQANAAPLKSHSNPPTSAAHAAAPTRHASVTLPRSPHTPATPRTRSAHAAGTLPSAHGGKVEHRSAAGPAGTSARAGVRRSHTQGTGPAAASQRPETGKRSGPREQRHGAQVPLAATAQAVSPLGAAVNPREIGMEIASARPGPATDSGRRHFGELRAALDDGWEIVPPIFARPLWSAADDSATAFNFVLHGPRGTRLVTVPQGTLVERFIRDRRLSVDYAR